MRLLIAAGLLAVLLGCASGGLPPIDEDYFICMSTCQNGTCQKNEAGVWVCVPNPTCDTEGCPKGQKCVDSRCVPRTCEDDGCPDGEVCEGGVCRPDNCPLDDIPWCKDVSQKCSSPEEPCKTNPSSDPFYCEEGPACVNLPQCPQFTDRGGTLRLMDSACDCWLGRKWVECQPNPDDNCDPPHPNANDPRWGPGVDKRQRPGSPAIAKAMHSVLNEIGDACGINPKITWAAIEKKMQARGFCAKGPAADGVSVLDTRDGMFERWMTHVGDPNKWDYGCVRNSGRGVYEGAFPHPDFGPGASSCPRPHPNLDRARIDCVEHNGLKDCTFKVFGQPNYCLGVGFPCMPGHGKSRPCNPPNMIRGACPMWGDNHPNRKACEDELAKPVWWCNGKPYTPRGNPWQTRCRGRWKICTEDGRTCAEGNR